MANKSRQTANLVSSQTGVAVTISGDPIILGVGNTELVRITGSGLVGVNSTTPNSSLSVGGTVTDIKLDIGGNLSFRTPYGGYITAYNGYSIPSNENGEYLLVSQGTPGNDVGLHLRGGSVGTRDRSLKLRGSNGDFALVADNGSDQIVIPEFGNRVGIFTSVTFENAIHAKTEGILLNAESPFIGIGTTAITNNRQFEIRENVQDQLVGYLRCRTGVGNTVAIGFLGRTQSGSVSGGFIGYDGTLDRFRINGDTSLTGIDHICINVSGNVSIGHTNTESKYGSPSRFLVKGLSTQIARFVDRSQERSISIILGSADSSGSGSLISNHQLKSDGTLETKQVFRFYNQGVRFEARDSIEDVSIVDQFDIRDDGYIRFFSGFNGLQFNGNTGTDDALDDYEEGTWTPTFSSSASTNPNGASLNASGTYTKIGRHVTALFQLSFGDAAAVSLDDRITMSSLPYDPGTGVTIQGVGTFWLYNVFSSGNNAFGHVGLGGSGSSSWYLYVTHVDGAPTYNSVLRGVITYETAT